MTLVRKFISIFRKPSIVYKHDTELRSYVIFSDNTIQTINKGA